VNPIRVLLALLVVAYVAESLAFALLGRGVIDEGVYLGAGRLVMEGQLPYRDFPFSQGPLVAYVYGPAQALFGSSVLTGRLLSWGLGVGGFAVALWIARSLGGRVAAGCVLVLSMTNLPLLWVSGTVRTQSLSTPLTLLGVLALAGRWTGALGFAIAPSLLLWSTSARLTNALAFVAVALWTAVRLRGKPRMLAQVAGIVGVQGLIAFAPLLAAPRDALFHILTAQLGRGERTGVDATSFSEEVLAKFEVFLAPETSFVAVVGLTLIVAGVLVAQARRGWVPSLSRPLSDPGSAQLTLVALAFLVFVPHLLLNRGFLTYFVTSSALLVPAIAIGVASFASEGRRERTVLLATVALFLGVAVLSAARQLPAWIGSGDASFSHFRDVARDVATHADGADGDCTIVTMETALAVETGCRVLPGLEYSLFSYFPKLSDEEATARGVVNRSLLTARIRELRPELIVLGPRGRSTLRVGGANRTPPTLGFLAPRGYGFVERHRISSGAFLRTAPDTVPVDVFVRDDLLRGAANVAPTP
jgi:hypothetical protein